MLYYVDMIGYCRAHGIEYHDYSRRLDYSHDWEKMELSPYELRFLIDNCVDIKTINK